MASSTAENLNEYTLRCAIAQENLVQLLTAQNLIQSQILVSLQAIQVNLTNFGENITIINDLNFNSELEKFFCEEEVY